MIRDTLFVVFTVFASCLCFGCGSDSPSSPATDTGSASDTGTGEGSCPHVEVVEDCQDRWCRIPAGCFVGGSPVDELGHGLSNVLTEVTLSRDYFIGQFEVIQGEWEAAGFHNPSGHGPNGDGTCVDANCPVENINWFEAVAYANKLSELHDPPLAQCYEITGCTGEVGQGMECTGVSIIGPSVYDCEGFRLPTHAEWEYATRAGTTTAFYSGPFSEPSEIPTCPFDANVDKIAWYCANAGDTTHPVGQKDPNEWGLYDPSGNANEWVNDQHSGGYGGTPINDPVTANRL